MEDFNAYLFFVLNRFAWQSPLGDSIIIFFANYVAYILIILFVLGLILLKLPKIERYALGVSAVAAAVLGRGIIVEGIRFFYHHPRPFVTLSGVHQLFFETGYSFPSGHATLFFALSAVIYTKSKFAGLVFFFLSALMSIARVMAGVHYPLDILGGAVLGTIVGVVCAMVVDTLFTKSGPKDPTSSNFIPSSNA